MRIIIKKNYDEMCEWVSLYIMNRINDNPDKYILGLPTGSTPIGVYKNLINYYQNNNISFKNVITFNMDEYVNLSKNHEQSYHYFMYQNLFNHIDIDKKNINLLDGNAIDLEKECIDYEEKIIKSGGIDLFLGGIGSDGHIAFNEPGSSLKSRTRIKTLCNQTIEDNSRFFNNISEVPTTALTVGVGTVMDAKEIVIMISGYKKAYALYKCIEEGINHMWTISALQLHPRVTIVCDDDATSELKVKTVKYFKELQLTTDIMGNPIYNYLQKNILPDDKIIIFSPHPDDDVIGMGGTMKLLQNKKNVVIVYMTSGLGGLDKNLPINTREKEAEFAVQILGYNKNQIIFLNLPFYRNKTEISQLDYDILSDLYTNIKPNHIFVCGDNDPNGTHKKCYEVIYNTAEFRDMNNQYIKNFWIYKGAWDTWPEKGPGKPNCHIYLPKHIFDLKKIAIQAHQSQDPPVITNQDTRTFVQRVIDTNKSLLLPGEFEEEFLKLNIEQFIEKMWI